MEVKMETAIKKYFIIFGIGAIAYCLIEIIVRQRTHWTMALTGGVAFCTLYYINTHKIKELAFTLSYRLSGYNRI